MTECDLTRTTQMLTGDKSTFAVECRVRGIFESFAYCNFRFWIGDEPTGSWNEKLTLGVLIQSAEVFMEYRGDRFLTHADTMSKELLWQYINGVATSDCPDDLRVSLQGRYRQRYLLHCISDDSVASVCEVIVVERSDGLQRLLWKARGMDVIKEIVLKKQTVDQVVGSFVEWAKLVGQGVSGILCKRVVG